MAGETVGTARDAAVAGNGGTPAPTVREATFDVLRTLGLTRIFSNPGSTEVSFLAGLPDDLEFVLGLHEGSVVGMATGYALGAARRPSPCCTRPRASATPSPRWPPRASTARRWWSWSASRTAANSPRSPSSPAACTAWRASTRCRSTSPCARRTSRARSSAPTTPPRPRAAPRSSSCRWTTGTRRRREPTRSSAPSACCTPAPRPPRRSTSSPRGSRTPLARARGRRRRRHAGGLGRARGPRRAPLVPGVHRGLRRPRGLPAGPPALRRPPLPRPRAAARDARARTTRSSPSARRSSASTPTSRARWSTPAPAWRSSPTTPPRRSAARRSSTILAEPSAVCRGLVEGTEPREGPRPGPFPRPAPLAPPAPGEPLRAGHVFDALAQRLPADAILVEESPSSRPELHARVPARVPMGFLSAAMGGLGFALPGTIGVRMALPDRPVVAVLGDGASLYAIQALWSAARYRVGALSWSWPTAATRSWTSSREHGQAGAVAGLRHDRHRRDGPRPGLRGDPHRGPRGSARRASTRCCRGWRGARPRSCSRSPSHPDAQAGGRRSRPRG